LAELRLKVGPKGQILVPKVFRDRYALKEGSLVMIEPEECGLLIRGRPSVQELERETEKHVAELKSMGIRGPRLGELRQVYLEKEFEELHEEAVPRR
jgi:AbrB family looped-hinge helix DNA binding protein